MKEETFADIVEEDLSHEIEGKVLPCPFCGNKPKMLISMFCTRAIEKLPAGRKNVEIYCKVCLFRPSWNYCANSFEEAYEKVWRLVEEWNTREVK